MDSRFTELMEVLLNGGTTDTVPESRAEEILLACINRSGTKDLDEPQSVMEVYLQALATKIANGDFGGDFKELIEGKATGDYYNDKLTVIGVPLFRRNQRLKSVTLPNLTTLPGENLFDGCQNLERFDLPLLQNGGYAMLNNTSLIKKVVFPSMTTHGGIFRNSCSSVEIADFHALVNTSYHGFTTAPNLHTLIIRTPTVCTAQRPDFLDGSLIANGEGYIYVPDDLVEAYKTATNWVTYANQIKPLSELPEEVLL